MTQDPSGKSKKELEGEIEHVVEGGGVPSSYSWIDEYTTTRVPTLETRRPARRKTRSKATRARSKASPAKVKAKTKAKAKTTARKRPKTRTRKTRTRTRPARKSKTGRAKTRSAKRKTARKGKAKKSRARRPSAARDTTPPPGDGTQLYVVKKLVETMPPSGRFGDKVYIASVWRRGRRLLGMTLPEFKRWLIDQNRANHLVLARADLPDAMNRELVDESEIRSLGSTFHVILDPDHSYQ